MCLATPMFVKSIRGHEAEVQAAGITRKISLTITPETEVGDYVLVHAGYAISVISAQEARETLKYFQEMAELSE